MKWIVLVPDGAADYALEELGDKTPLETAATPNMDRLAQEGRGGTVQMIPTSRPPGSDIGNLEIFGYDSRVHYSGRAPLEAASMGVALEKGDIAFRCNLISRQGDILVDYSAGHISSEEALPLIQDLERALGGEDIRFYPGVGYRHLMVFRNGPTDLVSVPPHDIMGQSIAAHLPTGKRQEEIRRLMVAAEPVLAASPTAPKRRQAGLSAANAIWLWGEGAALELESLNERYGVRGGVISAVDLVRGIGCSGGLEIIDVPGITGYLDTNYAGKAEYALNYLDARDFVYVHVEAPDEAGHNGDVAAKVRAIEDFDRLVVGPILEGVSRWGACRLLLTPDHRTPIVLRTHSREPVPFVLWGSGIEADGLVAYNEAAAVAGSMHLEHGHELMDYLMERL